jgi:hypothetical protein
VVARGHDCCFEVDASFQRMRISTPGLENVGPPRLQVDQDGDEIELDEM